MKRWLMKINFGKWRNWFERDNILGEEEQVKRNNGKSYDEYTKLSVKLLKSKN
jgi:hypothetical protein